MRFSTLMVVSVWATTATAQERNSNWVFGKDVWLKFHGDSLAYEVSTYEPSPRNACISDTSGNFVLLADDRGIRNAVFDLLPAGDSVSLGWTEASSNYVILPKPRSQVGLEEEKYVVVRTEATGERRACWVEVDLQANGGAGGLIGDVHWFATGMTARLAATPHDNGLDYWVMLHQEGSDAFQAYVLTSSGIELPPVVTHTGGALAAGVPYWDQDFLGPMKFSVQGDRLAMARRGSTQPDTPKVQLFDFDPGSGTLTTKAELALHAWYWNDVLQVAVWTNARPHRIGGLDFSASGEHLFVGTVGTDTLPEQNGSFYQFTLTAGTPAAIQNSCVYRFSVGYDWTQGIRVDTLGSNLQLATDDRIYARDVNFDNWNTYHAIVWLDSLPNDSPPTQVQFNLSTTNLYGVSDIYGYPNPCKRYQDSAPTWLGGSERTRGKHQLSLRPNPMLGQSALMLPADQRADRVEWWDTLGALKRTDVVRYDGPSVLVERGALPSGLYLLRVFNGREPIGEVRVVCE